jgi:type IV pilus assembly protein PilC
LSITVIGNTYIEDNLTEMIEKISAGNSLSDAVDESEIFEKLLVSMIKIGEETGSLDSILTTTSEFYEQETDHAIDSMLAILEPVLLIVMAVVIGTVLIAVMYPIITGYGTIGV